MDGDFHTVRWQGGEALLNQRVAKVETNEEINQDFLFYKLIGEIREIQARTPATTVKTSFQERYQ
ncbi:restriction modification system DNA specificity subunit [Candidatus Haloredivivus sp. G17]|nr:restriction modification system DNA specificity subunit [Candidatus Haloredivivus sp. G17]